ncbi:LysR family transcriptional regulator [Mameliella alba]|nr:LysR family transcriptional regulator [Mameliella alba]MBY6167878.1 LysR family transcriptional regulator [Mameliella alba]
MGKSDFMALSVQDMRLLLALKDLGTVSRAAEQLEISQSSASYGLEKLRRAFSDPLFVRQGAGMAATARGDEAAAYCADMLPGFEALATPAGFDPATSTRTFRIAATAYEIFGLLADRHQALRQEAPRIVLHVDDIDNPNAVEKLHGQWDMLFSPYVPETGGLKQRKLFEDSYAIFFDPEQIEPPNSIEAIAAAQHAVVSRDGNTRTNVQRALEARGVNRRIGLIVSSFEHLPTMMRGTPLVATLPQRFANGLFQDFAHVPAPLGLPNLSLYMVWSGAHDPDPGHRWLRNFLAQRTGATSGEA